MGTTHRNTHPPVLQRGWWAILVTAVVGLVLAIAPSANAATVTIHINGGLDPATVTVPPNTAVTFVNDDGARHRMRTTGGPAQFDTGGSLEAAGSSYTVTLTALGTYSYRDERNTGAAELAGTIIVSDTVTTTVPGSPTTVAPPPPMTATVSIGDRIYSPTSVTIAPGGTVTFTNNDSRAHTVTATDGSWDSGLMNTGATWSKTFPAGGTFSYFCDLHPDMTGRVVVSAGGTQPPATTTPPTTPTTTRPPVPPTTPAPTTTLPGTPPPTQASVMIMDFQYSPSVVTIAAGGTVTWTNHDSAPHTVTADDASYDSGMMRTGGTWSKTFATPGTYRYHCDYHPEMVATVVVLAPGATVPPGGSTVTTPPSGGGTGGSTATTVPSGGNGGSTGTSGGTTGGGSTGSTGGGASGAALPTTGSVAITGNRFTPGTITIAVGGTVTWTNNDAVPHTVTADDNSFDSGMMRRGNTWSRTFTAPGTYTYFCSLHPEMTGTVVVATPEDPTPAVVTGGGSHTTHTATGSGNTATSGGAGGSGGSARSTATAAGSATVSMANNQFQPVSVTVGVGGVVTWTNTDTIPHTVTADDGSFDSDILMPGQTFSYQFDTPGTVAYRCILHAGMAGEVVVSELPADESAAHAAQADAAAAAAAADVAVPAESPERLISITGGTFPAVTVLAAGHSVTWRNDDTVPHNVQALFGEFGSGELQPGQEFTFTFDEPGVHPYTCDLHQHMGGTIIVMPAEDVDLANSPTVAVTDTGFDPPNLTVHQGTTVVWAFGGQLPHTVTADDGSFDSGVLEPGQTWSFTFDELGEFPYSCILHPMMTGTITVVPADATIDEAATVDGGSAAPAAAVDEPSAGGNGAARIDGGGIGTPIVVGFGVGGGLLAAVLLALGVGMVTRKVNPHLA